MKKEKILSVLKRGLCGIIAAVVVVGGMPAVEAKAARDSYQVDISGTMYRSEVPKFLELLNNERVSRGLEPFVLDDRAMQYAEYRAMETSFLMDHTALDGSSLFKGRDLGFISISDNELGFENILGKRSLNVESMFDTWMNSPGHYNNLMNDGSAGLKIGFAIYGSGSEDIIDYGEQVYTAVLLSLQGGNSSSNISLADIPVSYNVSVPDKLLNVNTYFSNNFLVASVGDIVKLSPKYSSLTDTHSSWGQSYMNSSCGTWVSNNPDKVSIDANGNLRALAPTEEASVSFLVNGDPDKKYTHYVRVKEKEIKNPPITGLKYTQIAKDKVKLSWDASPSAKGEYYYAVSYRLPGDPDNYKLGETKGTSLTLTIDDLDTHYIVVACRNYDSTTGKWVSGSYGNPIEVRIDPNWSGTVEPDPIETPDPAPTISKVSTPTVAKDSYKSVKVSWKKASNVDGYQIYRSKSKSTGYTKLATTSSTSKVVSANVGQGYYYKVRAYKKQNGKTYYGSFSSPKGYRNYMSKPSFSVSSPSKKKAKATWKKVSGASGYYVQFASNSSFTKSLKKVKVNSSKLSATISGVSSGKYQYVRVSCYKTINGKRVYSKWSSAKRVKVR